MTIPWHHGRRFKGGLARVAHEQGPTYAKVQRRPGSNNIPSLLASAWLCQDVQSLTLTRETNEEKLKVILYSVCLPVLDFLTLQPLRHCGVSQNTQTLPKAKFHFLIGNISVGFLSPAYLQKYSYQARNSVSHLRLSRVTKSLFVRLRESFLFNSTLFSTVIKATRVCLLGLYLSSLSV